MKIDFSKYLSREYHPQTYEGSINLQKSFTSHKKCLKMTIFNSLHNTVMMNLQDHCSGWSFVVGLVQKGQISDVLNRSQYSYLGQIKITLRNHKSNQTTFL